MITTQTGIQFERQWAMPNAWTFTIPPIKRLLQDEIGIEESWIDPFAGRYSPAQITNDLNPEMPTQCHSDALTFLRGACGYVDGALLDPPYSITQAAEMYKSYGKDKLDLHPSNMGYWAAVKNELARLIKPGGKAICFGWSSMGLGKGRGFEMTRILLVPHGGSKNDTIVTVEVKL